MKFIVPPASVSGRLPRRFPAAAVPLLFSVSVAEGFTVIPEVAVKPPLAPLRTVVPLFKVVAPVKALAAVSVRVPVPA